MTKNGALHLKKRPPSPGWREVGALHLFLIFFWKGGFTRQINVMNIVPHGFHNVKIQKATA
ncbi:hypothetical protein CRP01_13255 [Flavilitoribacter nigricans DSM 23189 = NBRC 102662]|uniref:Uncharacterized protein n=1 Tax=Flavilitoribacter nigricans (strain ATCC 23147 / DSM 23189 / NBRC 102662 / NCIMB 1420 / SS-2) TaxID=1122177 RepID=A0A2D0NBQ4_FLAN2|nr:hypothetical protein CRP01_13255 [Flavilitoribacter nigricans DSM 23189 = NBRC 102662]